MFDPGDVLAFQSSGIPWLIWIQLVVLFLLIALLSCFTFFALDSSDGDDSTASATEGPTIAKSASTSRFLFDDIRQVEKSGAKHDFATTTFVINRRQDTQEMGQSTHDGLAQVHERQKGREPFLGFQMREMEVTEGNFQHACSPDKKAPKGGVAIRSFRREKAVVFQVHACVCTFLLSSLFQCSSDALFFLPSVSFAVYTCQSPSKVLRRRVATSVSRRKRPRGERIAV